MKIPDTILEMIGINKKFNGNPVLKNANFSLYSGEVHAIFGENGSGKTTLMNILAGTLAMDGGEIRLHGKPVQIKNAKHAQELGIGVIFQDTNLFYDMNIAENIFINQEPIYKFGLFKFINWKKINSSTKEILEYLNINVDFETPVKALGYGKQKLIEVARTIVNKSQIIIMDEITVDLTENEIEFLHNVIRNLKSKGVSIIYISHRLDELQQIADRITVIRDGTTVATVDKEKFDSGKLVNMMVGDKIKDRYPKLDVKIGKDVLIVKNVSTDSLLRNISFSLRKGEILGIFGLKGSGKSALAKVLFGIENMKSGNIYLNGRKIKIKSTVDAVRNGISYMPLNRLDVGQISDASIADNIVITKLDDIIRTVFLSNNLKRSKAERYIKMLGIRPSNIYELIKNLSGGNQKKVILAKWLFRKSKILILNEPTSSIDVVSKVDIYNILNELVMSGVSIILISSEIPELIGICDRILVMHKGSLVKEFNRGEATQELILHYASVGS
ncbi:MAG TPA: sugar ABC transporter ATP-binding protein [Clostridiaceae bacterium]|nr:sugar ABC transporter ATP-binding protein [Clostridiaceae bacterium]